MTKSYVLLCMYEKLKKGENINIDRCCNEFDISVPTFRRYMSALRNFLCENQNKEIVYGVKEKSYFIKN